jgi:hypothetical protein
MPFRRLQAALLLLSLSAGRAAADCPADCFAGGGPDPTDCFVAWSGGVSGTSFTCTDGAACDTDGQVDGKCTLGIQACINVPGLGSCTPAGLSAMPSVTPTGNLAARALASALESLGDMTAFGCTAPGIPLPLSVSLRGIKPGKVKLKITASSAGKRDVDKLKVSCLPSTTPISYAQQVEPIVTQKCAYSGCHDTFSASGGQVLDAGMGYANSVNARASIGKRLRVKPGSIKQSEMARRLLGQGIAPDGTAMPQGCPTVPPDNGCLTDVEMFTILAWIATGAAP